ncbi:hypothetical protein RAMLITH_01130 [Ramlibacter sp. RBP-2]|uniref:Uncharacterized protein n=1 Tax=Ramlibacter lithotrophicus TaxID=2606681 RepID=A0A7X6DC33_9BURK|nr:hypothetical protein [Ramlibacter lithotrophicus]NKE64409.1 hypothetical protein [Ramlibacter lithotrophicus]
MRPVAALSALLLFGPAPALAQRGAADPLRSAPCAVARAELEAALAQRPAAGGRLEQARHRAAQACLGASDDGARRRPGAAGQPQVVQPTIATRRQPSELPPAPAPPPPPLSVPRPTAITACDPAGCWDSEGRRLNQMGPLLVGPGGVCSGLCGLVACP